MPTGLPGALLTTRATILRPVRSYASGTKQPIVTETSQATGVRVRLEPLAGELQATVLGRLPTATHRLFTNHADLKPNDVVKDEGSSQKYVVREVGNFFGHHVEAILERKDD
jgi:hypothetical protein